MKITAQKLYTKRQSAKGFTLVELLVVIAIIAILAAVVVLIINPLELTRRGRDSTRISDLANLQTAINVAVQEATSSGEAILCADPADDAPCFGTTEGSDPEGAREIDGTGWVKVDLGSQDSVTVPTLPLDPSNNTATHYVYCSDGDDWEINAAFESDQYAPRMLDANDGGDAPEQYEIGSALTLIGVVAGCAY